MQCFTGLAIETCCDPVELAGATRHPAPFMNELVFEVIEEADGGYCAECLTESIVTEGSSWDELRANVREAVRGYYFDQPEKLAVRMRLRLVRMKFLPHEIPRDLSGRAVVKALCKHWDYRQVHQEGSHIILPGSRSQRTANRHTQQHPAVGGRTQGRRQTGRACHVLKSV
jgi:hypothetical protein